MHIAFLLTGGNCGNRKQYLMKAAKSIGEKCGVIVASSAIYETAAWGLEEQPHFYNQALKIGTNLTAPQLLKQILEIEAALGRVRQIKYGPRTIDIDILFYDDLVVTLPQLSLPHPELHNRRFALQCLTEIAPDYVHPVLNKTVSELLKGCADPLAVQKVPTESHGG